MHPYPNHEISVKLKVFFNDDDKKVSFYSYKKLQDALKQITIKITEEDKQNLENKRLK